MKLNVISNNIDKSVLFFMSRTKFSKILKSKSVVDTTDGLGLKFISIYSDINTNCWTYNPHEKFRVTL